jgi:hypothetical protein
LNNNFGARNIVDNVKDLDFEDTRHPFSQRKILFKKGVELDDDYGYYLIEISQTKNYLFFVAYDVQNITNFAKKYVKKMSLAKGLKLLEQFGYNLDKISKCIRINKKD